MVRICSYFSNRCLLAGEKNAEMVYGQTEENLQLPECTALAALQVHTHWLQIVL